MERSRRYNLKNVINKCRQILEEDFRTQLGQLGIFTEEKKSKKPLEKLNYLIEKSRIIRQSIEQAIQVQIKSGLEEKQAITRYIRECTFIFLFRIAALRMMEVRELIEETIVPREKNGGRSLRACRLSEQISSESEGEIFELALKDAFKEVSGEIGVLFDLNDGFSYYFPTINIIKDIVFLISCKIPEEDWKTDEILGWVYQYFNSPIREEFKSMPQSKTKHPLPSDIPTINRFYTPKWIVQYLVQNTLGRLWAESHNPGKKIGGWQFFVDKSLELKRDVKELQGIKILDPACGSGHFLIYTIEVLYQLYKHAHSDWCDQDIFSSILEKNVFGIDIDLRALQIAALSIFIKIKSYSSKIKIRQMNLVCADARIERGERSNLFLKKFDANPTMQKLLARTIQDLENTFALGSLICLNPGMLGSINDGPRLNKIFDEKDENPVIFNEFLQILFNFEKDALTTKNMGNLIFYAETGKSLGLLQLLSQKYDIILMNPPFGYMPNLTKTYVKKNYKYMKNQKKKTFYSPSHDYYASFIMQSYNLLVPNGFLGALTPRSHLFLKFFSYMRKQFFRQEFVPELTLDLGLGILDDAITRTAASVFRKLNGSYQNSWVLFCDLNQIQDQDQKPITFLDSLKNFPTKFWYQRKLSEFNAIPESPYLYKTSQKLSSIFKNNPCLDRDRAGKPESMKIADCVQGLGTGDDPQFVRFYWEIRAGEIGKRWKWFAKKGNNKKYFGEYYEVIDWKDYETRLKQNPKSRFQNEAFFLRENGGLCWPNIASSNSLNVQILPKNSVFSTVCDGIFLTQYSEEKLFALLGLLNSRFIDFCIPVIDPLHHHRQVGDVAKLPIPINWVNQRIAQSAKEIYSLLREESTAIDTSPNFLEPALLQMLHESDQKQSFKHLSQIEHHEWSQFPTNKIDWGMTGNKSENLKILIQKVIARNKTSNQRIQALIAEINLQTFHLYELSREDVKELESDVEPIGKDLNDYNLTVPSEEDVIKQLITYYIKLVCDEDPDGIVPIHLIFKSNLRARVLEKMQQDFSGKNFEEKLVEIENILNCSVETWIGEKFFEYHLTRYRVRPILWQITSYQCGKSLIPPGVFSCLVNYHKLTLDTIAKIQVNYVAKMKENLQQQKGRISTLFEGEGNKVNSPIPKDYQSQYQDIEDQLAEMSEFERRMQELISPRTTKTSLSEHPSWIKAKIAEIRDDGWKPNLDYGVRVNIEPLKELKLLPKVADKIR